MGSIFRFGSPFETRFLFSNVTQKSVPQMVPALAVLSFSCALLRRLFQHVCPMHPIMPWRYLQFDLAYTILLCSEILPLSLRHLYQSEVLLFFCQAQVFWFQLNLASEGPTSVVSRTTATHSCKPMSRSL